MHVCIRRNTHESGVCNGSCVSQIVADRKRPWGGPIDIGIGITQDFIQLVRVKVARLSCVFIDFVAQFIGTLLPFQFLEVVLAERITHAEPPRRTD